MDGLILFLILALFISYFLPSIIGWNKEGRNGILISNVLLGWTIIGWFVVLYLAIFSKKLRKKTELANSSNYREYNINNTEYKDEGIQTNTEFKHENEIVIVELEQIETDTFSRFQLLSSDYIYVGDWLVTEGDYVKIGQPLLTINSGNYFENNSFTKQIESPKEGYITIPNRDFYGRKNISNINLFSIFNKDIDRQVFRYQTKYQTSIDNFTNATIYSWNFIRFSSIFKFKLENYSGKDFICFEYQYPQLKLSEIDKILFLLSNNEIIEFPLSSGKYKIDNNTKGFKVTLYSEEIDLLSNFSIESIRILIESENQKIDIFLKDESAYPKRDLQFVIKETFSNYKKAVSTVDNYNPIFKSAGDIKSNNSNEICFVYLMLDSVNNYHKIGISNNPEYREKTLQSEKPTIELISHKHYPTRKIAESIEKALHESYKDKRIRGEWFILSEEDINNIKETLY